jgi:hypothetical protein
MTANPTNISAVVTGFLTADEYNDILYFNLRVKNEKKCKNVEM